MQQYNSIRSILFFCLAAIFLLYEMAVQALPAVMATPIMQNLQFTSTQFGVIMGCYFASYTLMQIPVGLLFDRYSVKKILVCALTLCVFGTVIFSISHSGWLMAFARFITGLGSAFAFVGVLVVADQWFTSQYFALLVGIAQLLAAIGAMLGQVPLAYLVKLYGWRHTTLYVSMFGFIIFVLVIVLMRDKSIMNDKGDQYPEKCEKNDDKDNKRLGLSDLKKSLQAIFSNSQTWLVALYACSSWAPITFFAELWGVPYLVSRGHITEVVAAKYIALIWLFLALASPLNGWISHLIKRRCIILQVCSLVGLISILMLLFVNATAFTIIFAMIGIGIAASGQIISFAIIKDIHQPRYLATAVAFNNMAVVIGGFVFQPLIGFILSWSHHSFGVRGHIVYSKHDFIIAFVTIPLLYLIGWFVSRFFIKETYCKSVI